MDDVDDQTVGGGPQRERPRGYQQGHHVEQVGQVGRHIQRIVEGQHEHVAGQDGDVVPHQVLLQSGRRRQARLVDDLTHPTNHLPRRIIPTLEQCRQTFHFNFIITMADGKKRHYSP